MGMPMRTLVRRFRESSLGPHSADGQEGMGGEGWWGKSKPAPWETWRTETGTSKVDEGEGAGRVREREGRRIGEAQWGAPGLEKAKRARMKGGGRQRDRGERREEARKKTRQATVHQARLLHNRQTTEHDLSIIDILHTRH